MREDSKQDELIGQLHTDNSGGIHILYGSAIRFDKEGKGLMNIWGGSDDPDDPGDPKYEYEFLIEWARIDTTSIKIRKKGSPEWTFLNYEISLVMGEYSAKYDKIISTSADSQDAIIKEWFWDIPEALYRKRLQEE